MPNVAFATYHEEPGLYPGDRMAADALERAYNDVAVSAAVWNNPHEDWSRFDLVVPRSTWDYHLFPDEFLEWLENLTAAGIQVQNAPDTIRSNIDKRYLLEFQRKGINIVPTEVVERGQDVGLAEIMRARDWERAVVKPIMGGSAYGVFATGSTPSKEDQGRLEVLLERQAAVLVQPFVTEIAEVGEYSSMFFGGEYSHTVLKKPGPGEYRTNSKFGASREVVEMSEDILDQARHVMELAGNPVYARVDYPIQAGRIVLAELELIEPYLFFEREPTSAERFARALGSAAFL